MRLNARTLIYFLFVRRYSTKWLAELFGYADKSPIYRVLRYYELPRPSKWKSRRPPEIKRLKEAHPRRGDSFRLTKQTLIDFLFVQKYSVKWTAEVFGVNKASIYNWLDYYGLPNPERNYTKKTPEVKRKIVIDYIHLLGIKKIARHYLMGTETVKAILNDEGVDTSPEIRSNLIKARMKCFLPINEVLSQIIAGELLGDSTLTHANPNERHTFDSPIPTDAEFLNTITALRRLSLLNEFPDLAKVVPEFNEARRRLMAPRTAYFRIEMAIIATVWIYHVAELLQEHGYPSTVDIGVREKDNEPINYVALRTPSSLQLEREQRRWYSYEDPSSGYSARERHHYLYNEKNVPDKLVMTAQILLPWYVGDGSCNYSELKLCTHGFTKTDVQKLANCLYQATGLEFPLVKGHKPGTWFLRIRSHGTIDVFFAYLERAPEISESLSLAKRIFPWKFDYYLKRKDVYNPKKKYVDEKYFQEYLTLLKRFVGRRYISLAKLVFPWKFTFIEIPVS
ncbi:MAG: hypothetical protein ACFFCZ_31445 [Promethearchaeota archaeon]